MSKSSKLEKDLKKAGTLGVTSWQIINGCETTNPQKLVEILRKKYGYDRITDIWETKTKVIDGTKTVIKWKRYFWQEKEVING
jgi:hypothetical protein